MGDGRQSLTGNSQNKTGAENPQSKRDNRPTGSDSSAAKTAGKNPTDEEAALKHLQDAVFEQTDAVRKQIKKERSRQGDLPPAYAPPRLAIPALGPLKEVKSGPRPDENQMSKDTEAIHELITHESSWISAIRVADIKGVNRILQNKSKDEREMIQQIYKDKYKGVRLVDDVQQHRVVPADYIQFRNILDRRDGNIPRQNAGRILHALIELRDRSGRRQEMIEKDIRDTVSNMNSKQIVEMSEEFNFLTALYGIVNIPNFKEALTNNRSLSMGTRSLLDLYLKGNDKLTTEDSLAMIDIALEEKDVEMFCEIMKNAPGEVRSAFEKNNGFRRLENTFSGKDYTQAVDYLNDGQLSAQTQIDNNIGYVFTNEPSIEFAINNMSFKEKNDFLRGKSMFLAEHNMSTSSDFDSTAVSHYKNLHRALSRASNSTNLVKWENMIAGDSFIPSLARHRGYISNSPSSEIARDIESMNEKNWQYAKQHPEQRRELRQILISLNKGNSAISQLLSIYDKKLAPQTYALAKDTSVRSVFDHINDHAQPGNIDCPGIIDDIEKMTAEEQGYYRTDREFRQNLDNLVTRTLQNNPVINGQGIVIKPGHGDTYLASARNLLLLVDQGKQPKEDVLYKLQHLSTAADREALQLIEKAFKEDPVLKLRINDPKTAEEKAYAEDFRNAARHAAPAYYGSLIKPLLETGVAPLKVRLTLHNGMISDDVESICQDIIQQIPAYELQEFRKDSARLSSADIFGDRYFNFLDEEQRKIVIAVLKQGKINPEDKIRALKIGWGGSSDIAEEIKKMKPTELAECQRRYALKYGLSLDGDLWDKLSAKDGDQTNRVFNKALTAEEQANLARDEIYKTLDGFGAWLVNRVGGSVTGDQAIVANDNLVARLSSTNYQRARDEAYKNIRNLPIEQMLEVDGYMNSIREATKHAQQAADNHTESKESAAEYTAMVAMAAAGIATAGIESPLLFTFAAGLSGAAANVVTRSAVEGANYDNSLANTGGHVLTGFLGGVLTGLGPEKIAAALRIGQTVAKEVAAATVSDVVATLERQGIDALITPKIKQVLQTGVQKGAQSAIQTAVAAGKSKVDQSSIDHLTESLMKVLTPANSTFTDTQKTYLSYAIRKALGNNLQNKPEEVAHRFILQQGLNTAAGGAGGGTSSAIEGVFKLDPNQPLDENATQLFIQTLAGTGSGAAGALAMSLAMHGAGKTVKKILKKEAKTEAGARTEAGKEQAAIGTHSPSERVIYGPLTKTDSMIQRLEGSKGIITFAEITKEDLETLADAKVAAHVKKLTIKNLNKITDLGAAECASALENLSKLTNLTTLRINDCGGLTDNVLASIGKINSLERLSLAGNSPITTNFGTSLITSNGLAHLTKLTNLKRLEINGNGLTGQGVKGLTEDLLKHVGKITNLTHLSILNNPQITDTGLAFLTNLTNLRQLELYGTGVTGQGVRDSIAKLNKLVYLDLKNTKVTKEDIDLAWKNRLENRPKTIVLPHTIRGGRNIIEGQEYGVEGGEYVIKRDNPIRGGKAHEEKVITRKVDRLPHEDDIGAPDRAATAPVRPHVETLSPEQIAERKNFFKRTLEENNGRLKLKNTDTAITDKDLEILAELAEQENILIKSLSGKIRSDIIEAGFARLAKLTKLEKLALTGPGIKDNMLAHIEKLTDLKELRLRDSLVSNVGLKRLENLSKLSVLDLSNSKIIGDQLESLGKFKSLQELHLSGNKITDDALKHLQGLESLRFLTLNNTAIGDAGLTHLKALGHLNQSLEILHLDGTQITGAGLENLQGLSELTSLSLSGTWIHSDELKHLAPLTNLVDLDLSRTPIGKDSLQHLKGLSSLGTLNLSETTITNSELQHLAGLKFLRSLHLDKTWITDNGLVHLKDMSDLMNLQLSHTGITDAGLAYLKGLPELNSLDLEYTRVKGPGLIHLEGTPLDYLNLSNTLVGDADLAPLTKIHTLEGLIMENTHVTQRGIDRVWPDRAARPEITFSYAGPPRQPSPSSNGGSVTGTGSGANNDAP